MRAKQFLGLYEAQQQLFEVEMSPSNLKKLANKIDGAKVGMEFEMYVPDVDIDTGDDDYEPEYEDSERYDENEPARSIDDIIDFFDDRDHNTRSTIAELRRVLEEKFDEYLETYVKKDWEKRGKEYLLNWIKKNADPSDIADYLDMPEDLLGDRIPTKEDYEEVADEEWKRPGNAAGYNYYDQAYESFKDGDMIQNYSYDPEDDETDPDENSTYIYGFDSDEIDQEEFLESIDINDMDDVYNHRMNRNNALAWSRWTDPEPIYRDPYVGSDSIEDIALSFMKALGYSSVAYSKVYHGRGAGYYKWTGDDWENVGSKKPTDCYAIEPDGSLSHAGSKRGTGLEFVSPPMSIADMTNDLKNIKTWAKKVGAYTNDSTGLHTNVSVPNYNIDNLDYVKLALLSGDKYVLNQFGRYGNGFCSSSLDIIQNKAKNEGEVERLLTKLRDNVEEIASRIVHGAYSNRKMVSINTGDPYGENQKKGYVEFRSPGGDWLGENFDKIPQTIDRFVVSLDAASDPQKYRREYLKALYKTFQPKSKTDNMSLFAQYMAGMITKDKLATELAKKKSTRKGHDELAAELADIDKTMYKISTRDGSINPLYISAVDPTAALTQLTTRSNVWATMPDGNIQIDIAEPGHRETPPAPRQAPTDDVNAYAPIYYVSDTAGTIHTLQIQANNADQARRIARLRHPVLDRLSDDRLIATTTPRMARDEQMYLVRDENTGHEVRLAAGSEQNARGRAIRNDPNNFTSGSNITVTEIS